MDGNPHRSINHYLHIWLSPCVVSSGKWCKIGGIWGWGCWMLGHGLETISWLCLVGQFFMHDGKEFFFRVEIYSISWLMLRNFEYPLLVYPLGRSDLDTMHTSKHKKKGISYLPKFWSSMSIWYRKRIRINKKSTWMGFLRCRSSNRQELEQEGPNRQSPRIREAPGGQGRGIAVWVNKRRIGRSSAKVKSTWLEC